MLDISLEDVNSLLTKKVSQMQMPNKFFGKRSITECILQGSLNGTDPICGK
jgi:hypothetical protein